MWRLKIDDKYLEIFLMEDVQIQNPRNLRR